MTRGTWAPRRSSFSARFVEPPGQEMSCMSMPDRARRRAATSSSGSPHGLTLSSPYQRHTISYTRGLEPERLRPYGGPAVRWLAPRTGSAPRGAGQAGGERAIDDAGGGRSYHVGPHRNPTTASDPLGARHDHQQKQPCHRHRPIDRRFATRIRLSRRGSSRTAARADDRPTSRDPDRAGDRRLDGPARA